MDSQKRSHSAEISAVERKKVCADKSEDLQEEENSANKNWKELYLSLLPCEVLLLICKYLSPADIISLEKVNQALSDIFYLKEVNFSLYRRDDPLLVTTFFNKARTNYVQKLNFNYYFYFKPQDLTNIICRCRNLKILSVLECGLKLSHILKIFKSCRKLEELVWSVNDDASHLNSIDCPNLKRLYVFCDKVDSSTAAMKAIRYMPIIKHFTDDEDPISYFKVFPKYVLGYYFEKNDGIFLKGSFISNFVHSYPPYLHLETNREDILSALSNPSNKRYSTVVVLMTKEIHHESENLMKCIEKVGGEKLKDLSFHSDSTADTCICHQGDVVSEILERVILTSNHITTLDLISVHFKDEISAKAVTLLPCLKNLTISACAFACSPNMAKFQQFKFSELVTSCPNIEDFELNGCHEVEYRLLESRTVNMKDWCHLKHLSLYNFHFRDYHFLQKIAVHCENFQSVSLISYKEQSSCTYMNDIIFLLRNAKKLRFLRIRAHNFYPLFERFWPSIAMAVNLEGICIMTESNGFIIKQFVIDGIKNLKYLNTFHLSAPLVSDMLYADVKKSMRQNGIKNISVRKCLENSGELFDNLMRVHDPYHFCCYSRNKDFDLF